MNLLHDLLQHFRDPRQGCFCSSCVSARRPASRGCSPAATASTKSAKRKAAEALLAAQYGGISTSTLHGTATAAAPGGMQFSWQFSSDAAPQQAAAPSNKRTKGMLSAAITRLGGPPAAAGAAQGPAAAAATAGNAVPQHQRQNPPAQIPQVLQQQREAAGSSWQQPPSTVGVLEEAEGHLHVHSDDSTAGGDQQAPRMLLSVEAAGAAKQQQRPVQALEPGAPVVVPACGAECTHVLSQGWCHSQVGCALAICRLLVWVIASSGTIHLFLGPVLCDCGACAVCLAQCS
jgi:hypothetical protein